MDDVGTPLLKDKPIDLDDAAKNEIVQVDTVAMATAKAFSNVPIRAAFSKVAAIEAEANLIQNQPGSELFTRPNSGPIKNLAGEEKSEDEKRIDQLRDAAAYGEEERKRQREEWAKQVHSFAGADLTGEQWGEMGAELQKGGALKDWLVGRLMKNGNSRDDAEKKAKEITDITLILAKPENEWTAEERKKVESGRDSKDFQDVMPELKAQMLNGDYGLADKNALHSEKSQSIQVGGDVFANALDLSKHHTAALAAQKPLEAVKPPSLAAAPSPPEPSMGGLG